jgi:hypothetical protein
MVFERHSRGSMRNPVHIMPGKLNVWPILSLSLRDKRVTQSTCRFRVQHWNVAWVLLSSRGIRTDRNPDSWLEATKCPGRIFGSGLLWGFRDNLGSENVYRPRTTPHPRRYSLILSWAIFISKRACKRMLQRLFWLCIG